MVRALILAVFGWPILAAAGGGPPAKAEISNQAQGNQVALAKQGPTAAPEPEHHLYRYVSAQDCYDSDSRDSADSCAQWRAAIAAEKAAKTAQWGNGVGLLGVLLSFASVILVLRALRQGRDANRLNMKEAARNTRRAVASAEDTSAAHAVALRNADAAAAQVEVAKENSEAQLRAWIVLDSVVAHEVTENGQIFFDVAAVWKNCGRTPSLRSKIGASWQTFPPGTAVIGHKKPAKLPEGIAGVIGPELTAWAPVIRLTPAQFLHQRISVISWVTYRDVFSSRRRLSEAHVEVVAIRAPGNQFAVRWTIIGETTAT